MLPWVNLLGFQMLPEGSKKTLNFTCCGTQATHGVIFRTNDSLWNQGEWFQLTWFYRWEYVKGRCIFNLFTVSIINTLYLCFNTHPYFVTSIIFFKKLNTCSYLKNYYSHLSVLERRCTWQENAFVYYMNCS